MDFLKGAKEFARNPLGIIALFISLIYGFASLLLDSSAEKLTVAERWPLIFFIVAFPIIVLITFYKLVTKHHGKLYAPGDFKDDKSFLRTLTPEEQEKRLDKEVKESLGNDSIPDDQSESESTDSEPVKNTIEIKERESRQEEHRRFREELKDIEKAVIRDISSELKTQADENIGIGNTEAKFDAFLQMQNGKATFLEVKAIRSRSHGFGMIDGLLYNAVVADKFFDSNFKLIIAVVYYFEKSELPRVERFWKRRIEGCPANIDLRFISRTEVTNA